MRFAPPPPAAAWRHRAARSGFEVAFFARTETGWRIEGSTSAVEDDQPWTVDYTIELDPSWVTRRAVLRSRSLEGDRRSVLVGDGTGRWSVDGEPDPRLDGCLDVDLESSALTNALPVHRLSLAVGREASAPAAFVRARGLGVVRLEQDYRRVADDGTYQAYDYAAPVFDFTGRLVYDHVGLVVDYPGIAVRAW